jgi:hypothetical protein
MLYQGKYKEYFLIPGIPALKYRANAFKKVVTFSQK